MSFSARVYCALLIYFAVPCYSHNINMATYYLHYQKGGWHFELNLSQKAILKKFNQAGQLAEGENGSPELEKSLISYLLNSMHIQMDGEKTKLELSSLRFGNHQTTVSFILPDYSKPYPHEVNVHLLSFAENKYQANILYVRDKKKRHRFVLTRKAKFKVHLTYNSLGQIKKAR